MNIPAINRTCFTRYMTVYISWVWTKQLRNYHHWGLSWIILMVRCHFNQLETLEPTIVLYIVPSSVIISHSWILEVKMCCNLTQHMEGTIWRCLSTARARQSQVAQRHDVHRLIAASVKPWDDEVEKNGKHLVKQWISIRDSIWLNAIFIFYHDWISFLSKCEGAGTSRDMHRGKVEHVWVTKWITEAWNIIFKGNLEVKCLYYGKFK